VAHALRSGNPGRLKASGSVGEGEGGLECDAEFRQDASGDRVRDAEHAEEHVLVPERPFGGEVEGVRERRLESWADTEAGLVRSSAPAPKVSSSRARTASKSIPRLARASGSIFAAGDVSSSQQGESAFNCRRRDTEVGKHSYSDAVRVGASTLRMCSVPM
jgi:hypothetical protein